MDVSIWERRSWAAFLVLLAGTTLAIAKIPFLPDTNPVVERFSGPHFIVLTVTAGIALLLWLVGWIRQEIRIRITFTHAALLAFFVVGVVSSLRASVVPLAIVGESGRYVGLVTWFFVSVTFFLASQMAHGEDRLRSASRVMMLTGTVEAIIGVSQALGLDIMRLGLPDAYGWMLSQGVGTLGNPNHLASVLVVPLVLAVGGVVLSDTARWRWISLASALLIGLSLVLCATRAAWLGGLVGIAMLAALARSRHRVDSRRIALAAVVVLGVIVAGSLIADQAIMRSRFTVTNQDTSAIDSVSSGRITMWGQALRVFARDPIVGVGPDSLRNAWKAAGQSSGAIGIFTDDPHSLPLLVMVSFGFIGFVLFAAFLLTAVFSGVRSLLKRHAPAESAMSFADVWTVSTIALIATSLLSVLSIPMLLALMAAAGMTHGHRAEPALGMAPDAPRPSLRVVITALTAALVVAGVASAAIPLYYNVRITVTSLDIPLSDDAISLLDDADRALPWRYEMMMRRAARLTDQAFWELSNGDSRPGRGRDRLSGLITDVDERADRYPADYYAWLVKAQTHAVIADGLGDPGLRSEAIVITEEALQRFPHDLDLQQIRSFAHSR